ncbi:meiotic recombination protein SPO11 [Vespa crabro]|uniref:meiotic recombination protein SPO11 n=1 Tax=Vespa crabro TaxID=7445 RepID=UPI001F028585|nr:meiotic recombination protein SPO11 [Vespa crabro]XP_046816519.1 meiotic recombination protein SPO11 [Vespa crabro]
MSMLSGKRIRSTLLGLDKEENTDEKRIDIPFVDNEPLRQILIRKIEYTTLMIIQKICSGEFPNVFVPNNYDKMESLESLENDVNESDDKTLEFDEDDNSVNTTDSMNFCRKRSKNKLALMMKVMAMSHRLLITNTRITRRSFYYDLKNDIAGILVPTQKYIDLAVHDVAELLNCAPWDLGLIATSKGLIAGNLTLYFMDNQTIDCNVPGGALIPQIISNIISIRAKAKFVLIVEKDSIFQKLLEENTTELLNCILITGKGYPDIGTRMLIKLLSEKLNIPIYIIVDADPFGMDIMCVYRFGSSTLSKENDSLACPKVRWLGIHPSELSVLGVKTISLSERDLSKLTSINNRHYMTEALLRQTKIMRRGKAEIEAISSFCRNFLTAVYISRKIKGNDYI